MCANQCRLVAAVVSLIAIFVSFAAEAEQVPREEGLVLWLDAADAKTITKDSTGQVSRWSDRSAYDHHARQTSASKRPRYVPEGLGGKPVVRFDGDDFLNLGQPSALDFAPGDAFTIAVVYRVSDGKCGTFIAKGGGTAGERAYQCYVAPGRLGAIGYGVMRENKLQPGPNVATYVCDGSRVNVFSGSELSFSFDAGDALSTVDVLVGARRNGADNTGVYYPLDGDVAEILVYNRTLGQEDRRRLNSYLHRKYAIDSIDPDADNPQKLVDALRLPAATNRLDDLSEKLVRMEARALPLLRRLVEEEPDTALTVAELLVRTAEKNRLSDGLAAMAGRLLESEDPFARGLAEWAITMKVGCENNGQRAVWPRAEPPDWYEAWMALSADRLLEADWIRQAVSRGIHRQRATLLESVDAMIGRATRMAGDFRRRTVEDRMAELRSIRERLADRVDSSGEDHRAHRAYRALWIEARRVMRAIVLVNPAIDFEGVVFVKQFTPHTVRNITRSYCWKHKPGGGICVLPDLRRGGEADCVLDGRLGPGYVWGLDLSWDADRVVFGYARQTNWPPSVDTADSKIEGTNVLRLRKEHEPIHIFEAALDGSQPSQLTNDPYWSDFEPTYCPNGDVVFSSDRCGRSAECGNDTYDHTNPNLYVTSADGSDPRKLTDSKDIDRYPHSLDDGRIAYTHWEYQERHFMEVHALWTVRPDGTMADALYKHHMRAPCGLRDTRSIPNSQKLVSIATGHHTFAYGPVVVVDPRHGMNNPAGLTIVTPGVRPQEGPMAGAPVDGGGVPDAGGLYQTPYAVDEKCFLVSYSYARESCTAPAGADSNGFALYLIDTYGNRELIHRDRIFSCTFPIPLRARPRPPRVPDVRTQPSGYATCYVPDVYDGMDGVRRGTIKYIRIAQHVGWPFDAERGQMDYIPGTAGEKQLGFRSWSPTRVIGTVPVAADGSASFTVPADVAVYFQALDERQMEIRRMRSMVSFKSGEVRGCRGCHESESKAPTVTGPVPIAMKRPPRHPTPPPWGADRLLGYEWLVQPILDRHCVDCHGSTNPDGGLDFTSTRAADGLYQSYRTMFGFSSRSETPGEVLVSCSDRFSHADVTAPLEFGSHRSPLIRVLLDDELHRTEVKLDQTEWLSLVTWVDANAPYFDRFFNKRPADGGEPRRDVVPDLRSPFVVRKD